jgi:hypothetical protein
MENLVDTLADKLGLVRRIPNYCYDPLLGKLMENSRLYDPIPVHPKELAELRVADYIKKQFRRKMVVYAAGLNRDFLVASSTIDQESYQMITPFQVIVDEIIDYRTIEKVILPEHSFIYEGF